MYVNIFYLLPGHPEILHYLLGGDCGEYSGVAADVGDAAGSNDVTRLLDGLGWWVELTETVEVVDVTDVCMG